MYLREHVNELKMTLDDLLKEESDRKTEKPIPATEISKWICLLCSEEFAQSSGLLVQSLHTPFIMTARR